MLISSAKLRANLYRVMDQVIATGKPIEVAHHGHIVKITIDTPNSKLEKLTKHPGTIKGDPQELVYSFRIPLKKTQETVKKYSRERSLVNKLKEMRKKDSNNE